MLAMLHYGMRSDGSCLMHDLGNNIQLLPSVFHSHIHPDNCLSSVTDVKLSFFAGQHNLVRVGREANAMCNLGHPCSIN